MCALPQGSARCDCLPTPMSGCHLHRTRRGRPLGAVVWLAGCPPVSSRAAVPSSTVPRAGGTCPGIRQYPSLALPTCVQTACLLWGSRLEARGGRGHQKPTLISPPVSEVCQHEHSPFYAPPAIPAHQSAQGQSADSRVLSRGGVRLRHGRGSPARWLCTRSSREALRKWCALGRSSPGDTWGIPYFLSVREGRAPVGTVPLGCVLGSSRVRGSSAGLLLGERCRGAEAGPAELGQRLRACAPWAPRFATAARTAGSGSQPHPPPPPKPGHVCRRTPGTHTDTPLETLSSENLVIKKLTKPCPRGESGPAVSDVGSCFPTG